MHWWKGAGGAEVAPRVDHIAADAHSYKSVLCRGYTSALLFLFTRGSRSRRPRNSRRLVYKTTFRVNRESRKAMSGGLLVGTLSIDTLQLRFLSLFFLPSFPSPPFRFSKSRSRCFDRAKPSPSRAFHPLNLSVSMRLCRGSRNWWLTGPSGVPRWKPRGNRTPLITWLSPPNERGKYGGSRKRGAGAWLLKLPSRFQWNFHVRRNDSNREFQPLIINFHLSFPFDNDVFALSSGETHQGDPFKETDSTSYRCENFLFWFPFVYSSSRIPFCPFTTFLWRELRRLALSLSFFLIKREARAGYR